MGQPGKVRPPTRGAKGHAPAADFVDRRPAASLTELDVRAMFGDQRPPLWFHCKLEVLTAHRRYVSKVWA